jgi:selenide, water dikinase
MIAVGVHACTDISGFGLLGHLREMLEASRVGAKVSLKQVPVLDEAWALVAKDSIPDGSRNNHRYLTEFVEWGRGISAEAQMILCDAQTSGGLLMAVPPKYAGKLLKKLGQAGIESAAVIGEIISEPKGRIRVSKV